MLNQGGRSVWFCNGTFTRHFDTTNSYSHERKSHASMSAVTVTEAWMSTFEQIFENARSKITKEPKRSYFKTSRRQSLLILWKCLLSRKENPITRRAQFGQVVQLTYFSRHGKSNNLTNPKSSPVATTFPAWETFAQLTSPRSLFLGHTPTTSSPRTLRKKQEPRRSFCCKEANGDELCRRKTRIKIMHWFVVRTSQTCDVHPSFHFAIAQPCK